MKHLSDKCMVFCCSVNKLHSQNQFQFLKMMTIYTLTFPKRLVHQKWQVKFDFIVHDTTHWRNLYALHVWTRLGPTDLRLTLTDKAEKERNPYQATDSSVTAEIFHSSRFSAEKKKLPIYCTPPQDTSNWK